MPTHAAAIYAQISEDTEGLANGVKRQIADCRALAEDLGWNVYDIYTDNDISAYSGKRRPEYERLLSDMENGVVNCVLVYNLDRLTRQPREFERFHEAASKAGITDVRFVTGNMDFGTDDGLFIGPIQAAVAANESATKSQRIKRKSVRGESHPAAGFPVSRGPEPLFARSLAEQARSAHGRERRFLEVRQDRPNAQGTEAVWTA